VVLLAVALLAGACTTDPPAPEASRPPGEASPPEEREDRLGVIRARLDGPLGEEERDRVVAALHDGALTLRNGEVLDVSAGVPWEGWGEAVTTSDLRLLHSLLIVHDLVAADRPEDLRLAERLVVDWAAANPRAEPAHPMAWHDETTARRTMALVRLHDALVATGEVDPAVTAELHDLLEDHLELLLDEDFHATGTNHGMFQDRAVLATAAYLSIRDGPDAEMDAAWAVGRDRLLRYYRDTVSPDGVHLEHAPAYHQLIAGSARVDQRFFADLGDEEAAVELAELHASMVTYATHVLQPDGTWPLLSTRSPGSTEAPAADPRTRATRPSCGAEIRDSIFIASIVATGWPAATSVPGSAVQVITPVSGAATCEGCFGSAVSTVDTSARIERSWTSRGRVWPLTSSSTVR
jgi:hypothetical protein